MRRAPAICLAVALAACHVTAAVADDAAAPAIPAKDFQARAAVGGSGGAISDFTVTGAVQLDGAHVITRRVTFRDAVTILLTGDSSLRFVDTTFSGPVMVIGGEGPGFCQGCELTGDNVTFNGRVSFAPKTGRIDLTDSTFTRPSVFTDTFTSLACRGCAFKSPARFVTARVADLDLHDAVFDEPADFTDTDLAKPRLSCFRGKPISITWDQFGEEWMKIELEEARAIKPSAPYQQLKTAVLCWRDNFKALGFERDASTANHEAVIITREHLEDKGSPAWFAAWAPEFVDGWGTRVWQPFLIAPVFVIAFWLYFWIAKPFEPTTDKRRENTPMVLFAFFFSLETFVPVFKVTGVKDWGWATKDFGRWMEVSEAAIGAILSAAAVYSFATNVL